MAVQVLQFRPRPQRSSDWSQQELAEFYRVESALLQAGIQLDSERGLTDEGDPWFVFCRADNGEVFIHFARIDGEYLIDGAAYGRSVRGRNFQALVRELMSTDAVALARSRPRGSNVFMHPAALLIALVGASFFHSGKADAAELQETRHEPRRHGAAITLTLSGAAEKLPLGLDPVQTATVLAGVMIGLDPQNALPAALEPQAPSPDATPETGLAGLPERSRAQDTAPPHQAAGASMALPLDDVVAAPAIALLQSALDSSALTKAPAPQSAASVLTAASPDPVALSAFAAELLAPQPQHGELVGVLIGAQPTALPNDAAAAAVEAVSDGQHQAVTLSGQLPTFLADLIGHGEHVGVDGAPSAPASGTPTPAPQPPASTTGAGDAPPHAGAPAPAPPTTGASAPSSGSHVPPAPPPVSPPVTATTPSTPQPPSAADLAAAHAHDQQIDGIVAVFMADAPNWQVIVQGRDLIVYDPGIFGHLAPNTVLDSVTFTFSDGSHVSLVGTLQEITDAYHVH